MQPDKLIVKDHTLEWDQRTYVMGILNVTPDSFSGDGLLEGGGLPSVPSVESHSLSRSLEQARRFVEAGVDILDVGGESTRPGSQPISAREEIERVVPVIRAIAQRFEVLISVDTYKAEVAEASLDAGAHMVNDVWGLRADPDLGSLVAGKAVPIILMHNRSSWVHAQIKERLGGRYVGVPYDNLIIDIRRELLESVDLAHSAGIPDERIILDPGIGFGKTVEQNLELLDRVDEICSLGYPVLIGPSRKSFIGYSLDLPPNQRLEGTTAAVVVGIVRGADIVRVHDVEFIARVVRMTDAIVRRKPAS
ncbi:MAG TPA: dihydropteroate synthase [Anaerolineales bacterium]|jgi:dihydropteroate synthase|nr:dihydropteroate synthase [Anaerolineales bacterium]